MKVIAILASLVAACTAQNIFISTPAANSSVTAGQEINVEVDRPNSLTGSQEVVLILSMVQCPEDGCTSTTYTPENALGTLLYNGPYNPQYSTAPGTGWKPPHQNFTVQVPTTFNSGTNVALIATHLSLYNAGPHPVLEVKFTPLTIA